MATHRETVATGGATEDAHGGVLAMHGGAEPNCDPELSPLVFIPPLSNEGSLSGLNFPTEF